MTVQAESIESLRTAVRGNVITPADAGYDDARRVWNAMIDKRPAVIVRPRAAADVIAAVNFARDNQLPLADPRRRAQRRRTAAPATTGSSSTSPR